MNIKILSLLIIILPFSFTYSTELTTEALLGGLVGSYNVTSCKLVGNPSAEVKHRLAFNSPCESQVGKIKFLKKQKSQLLSLYMITKEERVINGNDNFWVDQWIKKLHLGSTNEEMCNFEIVLENQIKIDCFVDNIKTKSTIEQVSPGEVHISVRTYIDRKNEYGYDIRIQK